MAGIKSANRRYRKQNWKAKQAKRRLKKKPRLKTIGLEDDE